MKQSFHFKYKNKVFGCSYRYDSSLMFYFGKVTQYSCQEAYDNFNPSKHSFIQYFNIPLSHELNIAKEELISFCKKTLKTGMFTKKGALNE